MNLSEKTNREYFRDLLIILLFVGIGFTFAQLINLLLVQIIDPGFFEKIASLNESRSIAVVYLLKLLQFSASVITFVIPPLLIARILNKTNIWEYLKINKTPGVNYYILVVLFLISIMPALNIIIEWNQNITLPDWLGGIKETVISAEESAHKMMMFILRADSYFDLLVNIVVIAMIPAIGEELLFRGVIQRFLNDWLKNVHLAILISAFLFSAIHVQFFGFVPRFILGAIFGYLVYYSNSLWPAIWAHFVNNALAVTAIFYISKGDLSEEVEKFGAETPHLMFVIAGMVIAGISGYFLIKKKYSQIHKNPSF